MTPARRFCRLLVSLIMLIAVCLAMSASGASAATISYAGLVVRHGDEQLAYAYIGFEEEQINGIELLKRSGLDVVTVTFGGLGEGVCSIDEHGCHSTVCRKRVCQGPKEDDPFWQYFRQSRPGSGDWTAMALGGSGTKVRNGDIDGWSWTGTTPGLPPLTLEAIARKAGYDGRSFDRAATPNAGAILRREGTISTDEGQSAGVYIAAAGLLALSTVAIFVLSRLRHRRRAAS